MKSNNRTITHTAIWEIMYGRQSETQHLLNDIAQKAYSTEARVYAAGFADTEIMRSVLEKIIKDEKESEFNRCEALRGLHCHFINKRHEIQAYATDVAENAKNISLCLKAAEMITDEKAKNRVYIEIIKAFPKEYECIKLCVKLFGEHDFENSCSCNRCGKVDDDRHKWEYSHTYWYCRDGFSTIQGDIEV